MEVFNMIVSWFNQIINLLNQYTFANVPLFVWFISFIILSIVISVFWRGARG